MTQSWKKTSLDALHIDGESFYCIHNVDELRPFLMSVVSDTDHWMFISSNGGLSAGRKNAELALFPYYTDDKISESAAITGSKSIFQIKKNDEVLIWEPWSERLEGKFKITRNLYKNTLSNKVIFEEINHDLQLRFRYRWSFSDTFGFVKTAQLSNFSKTSQNITLLDGLQNILPFGVGSDLQNKSSNLVDAYKRSELDPASGMGIFALSAIIVDKAEPSEALKASTAFALGLTNPRYLLSTLQLKDFRKGMMPQQEQDIKAEKAAYFVVAEVNISEGESKDWLIAAEVNQNHTAIVQLIASIQHDPLLSQRIHEDVDQGTTNLAKLLAAADGIQYTADPRQDARHCSNVLFNIMRGGIFDDHYQVEKVDFARYLADSNPLVLGEHQNLLQQIPAQFSWLELQQQVKSSTDADLIRLATEYLPLKFSRRHGDPSRPWNRFNINIRNEVDKSKVLDYEGNWRDLFQNWEALAYSYPLFIQGMIFKFLNASTFDGYNPYRVTKVGFDWETIEPDDPWSYIGYWGDHQIIYLLKFLEFAQAYDPDLLSDLLDKDYFVYALVPYRIKSYAEILANPKDTIDFDFTLHEKIMHQKSKQGADAALLRDSQDNILHVNLLEKLLATALSKLSNFILEGGIWMNTQRPEWNDANNALVGNGVSMVTLYYLNRFLRFFKNFIAENSTRSTAVSVELADFYKSIQVCFQNHLYLLKKPIQNQDRKQMLDQLGQAGSDFRSRVYKDSLSGAKKILSLAELSNFIEQVQTFVEQSIHANRRTDQLYHGYNLMTTDENQVILGRLSEMLEGQVAVLSSGQLSTQEAIQVLDALRSSALYREDQSSYLLYPNKNLPGFLQKNTIPAERIAQLGIPEHLIQTAFVSILERDSLGSYHFNGDFKNANDVKAALLRSKLNDLQQQAAVLDLFEEVFDHKAFTGRSGTFFGYEGLGSIYWHMVSKLRLAVLEVCRQAFSEKEETQHSQKLLEHYYAISAGLGIHKTPDLYGAFPTDPYSHTPSGKGAQQPGMTGQVKEDILCRLGELGLEVQGGNVHFRPHLLRRQEFLKASQNVYYFDLEGNRQVLNLPEHTLFFTLCQVPIIYFLSEKERLEVQFSDGTTLESADLSLGISNARHLFQRDGLLQQIRVFIKVLHP